MGLLDEMDRRREDELRDRENSARLAQAYATFQSKGLGTYEMKRRVRFGLSFLQRPYMSYGSYADMQDNRDAYIPDNDLLEDEPEFQLPVCSGFVTEWDLDERGLWVGAWIAVKVYLHPDEWPDPETAPKPEIEHHFTFSGLAMKDFPMEAEDVE